jgi:hypothetical protein
MRDEDLPVQRALDQVSRPRRVGESFPLAPVDGQHRLHGAWRQVWPEFGPGGTVPAPSPLDAGVQVMPRQRGQGDWVPAQDAVQQVVRWKDFE